MSSYAAIDPIIMKWVERLGTVLMTENGEDPARFFYTPGDPPFECFQISVAVPVDGRTTVYASAVDTNDDTEDQLTASWEGPAVDADGMLAKAVETINGWKVRQRIKPDPPSPW